jgi:SAM-dependent methyltransferase
VEVARVERWDARGRRFDLLVSAQAWHWVDPVLGPAVAAGVLRPGGVLALFWNYGRLDPAVQRALDAVYAEHAPELLSSSAQRGAAASLAQIRTDVAASGRFAAVERRDYPWQRSYPAADYAALLTTHSDHRQLPPGQLERLVAAVRTELERHGGRAVVRYRTELILAHTPAPEPVAP